MRLTQSAFFIRKWWHNLNRLNTSILEKPMPWRFHGKTQYYIEKMSKLKYEIELAKKREIDVIETESIEIVFLGTHYGYKIDKNTTNNTQKQAKKIEKTPLFGVFLLLAQRRYFAKQVWQSVVE